MPNLARAIHVAVALLVVSTLRAQVVRQVTDAKTGVTWMGEMDGAGTTVFAVSASDPYGTNPRHANQIFRWDRSTGAGAQLTFFHDGVLPENVSVSDDGGIVAFVATGNLTGENPDRGQELFRINGDGSGLVQLTHAPSDTGEISSYRVAGGGSVVALTASFDYLGSNPVHESRLFVMNINGSGLREFDTGPGHAYRVSASNDGERLVFGRSSNVYGICSDGSGLHVIAETADSARLSGDGSTVVLTSRFPPPGGNPGWCNGGAVVVAVDFEGTGATRLSGPCPSGDSLQPDVSDDGQTVVYTTAQYLSFSPFGDVWRIRRDGSGESQLTFLGPAGQQCYAPRISGSAGELTFLCAGVDLVAGSNTDRSPELYASSVSGTARRQLSSGLYGSALDADLSADGTRIVFASSFNFLGEPQGIGEQIYRIQSDGSDLTRLSSLPANFTAREVVVSDNGRMIVFVAGVIEPFNDRLYIRKSEGAEPPTLLIGSSSPQPQHSPDINADGSLIVFESAGTLFKVRSDGTGLQALTMGFGPRINAPGVFMAFVSRGGVWRMRSDGTDLRQVASLGFSWFPDISADGDLVVYVSNGDPLGTNPGHAYQIYLYRASTEETIQLTEKGSNSSPSISRDGAWVYYSSYESGASSLMRVHVRDRMVERVGPPEACQVLSAKTNGDGSKAVFRAAGDCVGRNADGNAEVYFIDRDIPPRIVVSPGTSPTLITWDAASGPARYDVIRGDVANLRPFDDGAVDLGPVACLENDSTDTNIRGSEDTLLPAAGHAFFYIFRGSPGGDYGRGSNGAPRVAGPGACAD